LSETEPWPRFEFLTITMTLIASRKDNANDSGPWPRVMAQVDAVLNQTGVHPAQAIVLVPYAQLMHEAKAAWAEHGAGAGQTSGFVPRFESTMNWANSMVEQAVPGNNDIRLDAALDALTAAHLLAKAGLGQQSDTLQALLVESAWLLARVAAAQNPSIRLAWGAQIAAELSQGMESPYLAFELAVGRIALAWASSSSYPTDVLFATQPQLLITIDGLQTDPLAEALKKRSLTPAVTLTFAAPQVCAPAQLHAAQDAEDEAQRAAACVLAHLALGRSPVALIAQDRLLTRRIGAMLAGRGVLLRDETGWTLSTTRAAATLMGFLRALPWDASTDAVLDWLKNAPAFTPADTCVAEAALRKIGARFWRDVPMDAQGLAGVATEVQSIRDALQSTRPLADWLQGARRGLQTAGQWDPMASDAAGKAVIAALHLDEGMAAAFADLSLPDHNPRMRLQDFTSWAMQALESGSFVPAHPASAQVVILPLSQLLGRSVAAVVLPGCDENRLPVSPEPPGQWTPKQRALLGLSSRADLATAQRAAWRVALGHQHLDVLWRQSERGERLMPSGFVQELLLDAAGRIQKECAAVDPRVARTLAAQPTEQPMPTGGALLNLRPVLSATAYEDLRRCPYRFFALRLLKVQEADELESELGKRDFGNWLHATLHIFQQALKEAPPHDMRARVAMINIASEQASKELALSASEFLPFAAIWPGTRDGYLNWLARHEATGASYSEGEVWKNMPLGSITLSGKLDRIDTLPDGSHIVMDYKTEALEKSKQRIKSGQEDTQLAFYAALLPDDTLAAAYVNLGETSPTQMVKQDAVVELRDDLIGGILSDMARIANDAKLPALGEGAACEFCAARGMCRKDFWS
jgi:ATP-dependent helicase/nuclease subunit B